MVLSDNVLIKLPTGKIRSSLVLVFLDIDMRLDSKHFPHLTRWYGDAAHGTERVSRFADVQLFVISLFLASGHVVDNLLPPQTIHCVLFVDGEACFPHDDFLFYLMI